MQQTKKAHWGKTLSTAPPQAGVRARRLCPGGCVMHWLSSAVRSHRIFASKNKMLKKYTPILSLVLALALTAFSAPPSRAEDYPARTVKIVVPFPAGGTADVMPRIIADWLSRKWGQPVIIEDRAGAAGDQSKPLSAARLRSAEIRACRRHRPGAECAGGQSGQNRGQQRQGFHRL